MFMVVAFHMNFYALGVPTKDICLTQPGWAFIRVLHEQAAVIAVNVFVLISGWFGIRASMRGAISFFFQVAFYSLFAIGISYLLNGFHFPDLKPILKQFYFGFSYWFVPAYFILYAFSPVLNAFIACASQKQFKYLLITFFLLEFVYGFISDAGSYMGGYSPIAFMGLYLLSRYIAIHRPRFAQRSIPSDIIVYLSLTVLAAIISYFSIRFTGNEGKMRHYNSPLVIASALFFFLAFSKLLFTSNLVNRLALSAFAIYLIHANILIIPHFVKWTVHLYEAVPHWLYFPTTIPFILLLCLICIGVDQVRIKFWNILNHRILSHIVTNHALYFHRHNNHGQE